MSSDVYESCKRIVHFVPSYTGNAFIERKMRQTIDIHNSESGKEDIANVTFNVNGKDFAIFHDSFSEITDFKDMDLLFSDFKEETPWYFSIPTTKMKILPNGVGWLHLRDRPKEETDGTTDESMMPSDHPQIPNVLASEPYGAQSKQNIKTMFRLYLTKYFKPQPVNPELNPDSESEDLEAIPYGLIRIEQLWNNIHNDGIIPIQVKLCAYNQTTRYIYHIDLLRGKMLRDVREGNIPNFNRRKKSGLDFFQLDRLMTYKNIPGLSKKIFEIIFESNEIDTGELSHIFHLDEKKTTQFIDVLIKMGFVTTMGKPPNQKYIANMEAMVKSQG